MRSIAYRLAKLEKAAGLNQPKPRKATRHILSGSREEVERRTAEIKATTPENELAIIRRLVPYDGESIGAWRQLEGLPA